MRRTPHRKHKIRTLRTLRKPKIVWGYHLIVNAGACDHAAICSKSTIAKFTKELVQAIDMVAFGAPRIVMFGSGNKKGYTLVQLIETSNITAHFTEDTNDMYLDIFSCKSFDPRIALSIVDKHFHPQRKNIHFLKRQA